MSLPGRILYQTWHRPWSAVRLSLRQGGPWAVRETARQRREMEVAATLLPPLPTRTSSPHTLRVHLLTGQRHAFQTAFCLHSLARYCSVPVHAEIYDDGTLDPASADLLRRLSPALCIHDFATLRTRLDAFLPAKRFPVLRERWLLYPHIRKLIDVHLGHVGWRLVLDSDLLFWREPRLLLDWAAQPDRLLHATDCTENYGYSRPLLEQIAGGPVPALVNVGICGLHSESIDWDFLESAAKTLIAAERTSYYLEQALVALLAAGSDLRAIAPPSDYITQPSLQEIMHPTAVMHHYVDTSRTNYFRHAWRAA